ncbi:MAG: SPFH domain-containing protein [Candidatus Bathyarchaeia archaeon]|jgi:membrane protease subunit (stomatin/prohibitin family)
MPQVIEWASSQANAEEIIYRWAPSGATPGTNASEAITWGAQLIVHEYEVAVFFRDGKAYDVFGPGRHTLTTLNLPLLTGALTRIAGYGKDKPFTSMVIYIATKVFNGKWGTSAQTTELAPLKVYGQFLFKIEDATLFVNEVVGGQNAYTTDDVNNFLRGFLNEKIIAEISHYDLVTVFTRLQETSVIVKNSVLDYFKRLGIELTDLRFEGIDTTPEYRQRLFYLKTGNVSADTVLRMETVQNAAASLGSGGGGGGGAGLGTGMVLIPQVMNSAAPPAQAPAQAMTLLICPKCGARVPATSKFCPECGASLTPPSQATINCPKCGKPIPANSKFCPECGTTLTQGGT